MRFIKTHNNELPQSGIPALSAAEGSLAAMRFRVPVFSSHSPLATAPLSGIIYIVCEETPGDFVDCTVYTGGDGPRLERGEQVPEVA
jgi:hypothetical protein